MMKTLVEFKASKFPPYEGEEEEINPGIWGKRLAQYLTKHLAKHNIHISEIIAEDWGYYLPIQHERAKIALCCANQGGEREQFVCFIDPSKPKVRRFFGRIDLTPDYQRLYEALKSVLESDPDIRDLVWQDA